MEGEVLRGRSASEMGKIRRGRLVEEGGQIGGRIRPVERDPWFPVGRSSRHGDVRVSRRARASSRSVGGSSAERTRVCNTDIGNGEVDSLLMGEVGGYGCGEDDGLSR